MANDEHLAELFQAVNAEIETDLTKDLSGDAI
jgi:hypothetical protein